MQRPFRLIARLDIKNGWLIKGVKLEGWRRLGQPSEFAQRYYRQGIDEIVYMDCVASLYGRNTIRDVVTETAEEIFIPITVGGGVRSIEEVDALLRAGADKVAINSAATIRPELLSECAERFGSQCIVASIEAARRPEGGWKALRDLGREPTGLDVLEWASRCQDLGAGEILLTSVDHDGTRQGLDIDLVRAVTELVSIPVIASGGVGTPRHLIEAMAAEPDAVAVASVLHFQEFDVPDLKAALQDSGIFVRAL